MAVSRSRIELSEQFPIALTAAISLERERRAEAQLFRLRAELAEIHRELYESAQLQRALSGPRLVRRGSFEIAAEIFPVRHLSGDFFSITDRNNTTLLALGDIAGKGLSAGLWFTHLLGLTRTYGESMEDVAEAMSAINRHVCESYWKPPLTSMFMARLDWSTGELTYCNAGHPAPIVTHANGEIEYLREGGMVLGVMRESEFACGQVSLATGDALAVFSDGLPECRDATGTEFGTDRIAEELVNASDLPTVSKLFSIIGAAQDFAGTQPREDDCTMMVIEHKKAA